MIVIQRKSGSPLGVLGLTNKGIKSRLKWKLKDDFISI